MDAKLAVFGATGGASKASDKCSFAKISGNNKDWCNGRGEQGKDALACVPKGFKHGCLQVVAKSRCRTHRPQTTTIAMDAKPTKHTQTLPYEKRG